jgi:hypothetical protein
VIGLLKNWKLILGGLGVTVLLIAGVWVHGYFEGKGTVKNEAQKEYIDKSKSYDKAIANRPDRGQLFNGLRNGKF